MLRHPFTRRAVVAPFLTVGAAILLSATTARAVPVTSGLELWLDASNMSSINGGAIVNGGAVSSWNDVLIGGNVVANNAAQGTASRQPIWMQSVAGLGGMSAVRFDGLASTTNGDEMIVTGLTGLAGNNVSIFVVSQDEVQQNDTGSCCRPMFVGSSGLAGPNYGLSLVRSGSATDAFRYDVPSPGDNSVTFTSVSPQNGSHHIYGFVRNGNLSVDMIKDGTRIGGNPATNNATNTTYNIGAHVGNAARHYTGNIAEIIAYDRTLNALEVSQVGQYLSSKYGIAAPGFTLPAPDAGMPNVSGLKLWLDASNPATINGGTVVDGAPVSAWNDVVTINNPIAQNAVQATAARQPIWVQNVAGLNGKSAIRFDGSDVAGQGDRLGITGLDLGQQITAFFVALDKEQTPNNTSCCRPILSENTSNLNANGHGFGFQRQGFATDLHVYRGDTPQPTLMVAVPGSPTDLFHLYTVVNTATDLNLFLDGEPIGSLGNTFVPTGTGYTIGGNVNSDARHYMGDIAEVIIFDHVLTPEEINVIGNYLEKKYGLDTAYEVVPEPASAALLLLGAVAALRRRRHAA